MEAELGVDNVVHKTGQALRYAYKKTVKLKLKSETLKEIALGMVAFLTARAVFFESVAPFGLSFYAALPAGKGRLRKSMLFVVALGMLSAGMGDSVKYIIALLMFTVLKSLTSHKKIPVPIIAGISLSVAGALRLILGSGGLYEVFMLLLESGLCVLAVVIMGQAMSAKVQEKQLDGFISRYIVVGLCFIGASGLSVAGRLEVINIMSAVVLMIIALRGGAGAGAIGGIILGALTTSPSYVLVSVIGIYSICGAAAGTLRRFGREGAALGFIAANAVLDMHLSGWGSGVFSVYEVLLAVVGLYLIPLNIIQDEEDAAMVVNTKEVVNIWSKAKQWYNTRREKHDAVEVIDIACDKVCRRCSKNSLCWSKNYTSVYDAILKTAPLLQEYGRIEEVHLPEYFNKSCVKRVDLVAEITRQFERRFSKCASEKPASVTKKKFEPTQDNEGMKKVEFCTKKEQILRMELDREGVAVQEITILRDKNNRFVVSAKLRCSGDGCVCDDVVRAAERVLQVKMRRRKDECIADGGNSKVAKRCYLELVQRERYRVVCGAAQASKDGQQVCGDSYVCTPVGDGKFIAALSDGMGSGAVAAHHSKTTIELLRQFLDAGLQKRRAIKIINSVLMLSRTEETFATMDVFIADLWEGSGEFIKIGANTTYVKNKDEIARVTSRSLPAGILGEVDCETVLKRVEAGNYIVMLTDGIEDAQNLWVEDFLREGVNVGAPQQMADEIINEALLRNGGAPDDMTVLVALIQNVT